MSGSETPEKKVGFKKIIYNASSYKRELALENEFQEQVKEQKGNMTCPYCSYTDLKKNFPQTRKISYTCPQCKVKYHYCSKRREAPMHGEAYNCSFCGYLY